MTIYTPVKFEKPRLAVEHSAWEGLDTIILDIIERFDLRTELALELGVDQGYSISALANYFKRVVGVDTFQTNWQTGLARIEDSNFERLHLVKKSLQSFPNVELILADADSFIEQEQHKYDLIHIDLNHGYEEVVKFGSWALEHSKCVIIHDTISYIDTMEACKFLESKCNISFYNYPKCNGLAILVAKREL